MLSSTIWVDWSTLKVAHNLGGTQSGWPAARSGWTQSGWHTAHFLDGLQHSLHHSSSTSLALPFEMLRRVLESGVRHWGRDISCNTIQSNRQSSPPARSSSFPPVHHTCTQQEQPCISMLCTALAHLSRQGCMGRGLGA